MTGFWGMDIPAVRALAAQLMTKADEIEAIANALTTQLNAAQWQGPDADAFRSDWQGAHRAQLFAVGNALRDASSHATANANQQEQAGTT
jgi:uncharacterized protein YukE